MGAGGVTDRYMERGEKNGERRVQEGGLGRPGRNLRHRSKVGSDKLN